MITDMEVDKVANMVADVVAALEVDKVANMVDINIKPEMF